jgi:2-polyprenyl-3-methyl-5-hydroxy-6-metoxy-1,4-benzoquinol methylase
LASPPVHLSEGEAMTPQSSAIADSHRTVETLDPTCPYCGASTTFFIASTDRNRHTTEEVFHYFSCNKCGLIFMNSPPADMSPYYKGGYEAFPTSAEHLASLSSAERYRVEPILKHKSSGRYLEVGPWRGIMCNNMKQAGFEVTAIERDSACIDYLRNTIGAQAIQSDDPAQTMNTLPSEFDVIASWHSLEHLPKPWRFVEEAGKLLRPGGILLISMPNPESYEFSVMKAGWMHLDTPRHLHFFPLRSLQNLCSANGMSLLEVTTSDPFSRILTKQAWYHWVRAAIRIPFIDRAGAAILGRILRKHADLRKVTASTGASYTAMFVKKLNAPES